MTQRALSMTMLAAMLAWCAATGPALTQQVVDDRPIMTFIVPAPTGVEGANHDHVVAVIGSFHEAQRQWWPEAMTWNFPSEDTGAVAQAHQAAQTQLQDVRQQLVELGVDDDIVASLRVYPVEAMTDWLCVMREGCYPKGVMVGTDPLAPAVASALCQTLTSQGRDCALSVWY